MSSLLPGGVDYIADNQPLEPNDRIATMRPRHLGGRVARYPFLPYTFYLSPR